MRHLIKVMCIALPVQTMFAQNASSLNDFFPLSIGMSRAYTYSSVEEKYESLLLTKLTIDSGQVRFLVLSKSEDDSLFHWLIQEHDSISHIEKSYAWWEGPDTTYTINRVSTFTLTETKSGLHRLSAIPRLALWRFPSFWTYLSSVFRTGPDVFRYSDQTEKRYLVNRHQDVISWFDSVSYYQNIGLVSAHYVTRKGPNTPYLFRSEAQLISPLVSVEGSSHNNVERFSLLQNYPNPFNAQTNISFTIPFSTHTSLVVLDLLGREVSTLTDNTLPAGHHTLQWNTNQLTTGIYFYRLTTDHFIDTKKLILLR